MKKTFTLLLTLFAFSVFAQKTIIGTVTSEKGEPLVGASVWIKGTTLGTLADENGHFSLKTDKDDTFLSFSFAGMQPITKEISDSKMINAVLGETTLDTFVVIGYGGCIRKCNIRCFVILESNSFSAQHTTFQEKSTLELRTLGNPFKDFFAIDIKSETDEKAIVSLYNIEGKMIKSLKTNLFQGNNRVEMNDISNLPAGLYNVSVNLIQQNDMPQIIEKSAVKAIPNELFKKIQSLNPEFLKYPNHKVLPLSKSQYELLFRANTMMENIGKVKDKVIAVNPKYDSWDIESDAIVEEADEDIYPSYRKEMTQIFNEYQAIMTNSAFKDNKNEKEYDIEDFDSALFFKSNNIMLIQKEIISRKKDYSHVLVKM